MLVQTMGLRLLVVMVFITAYTAQATLVNQEVQRVITIGTNIEKHVVSLKVKANEVSHSVYELSLDDSQTSRYSYAVALFNNNDKSNYSVFEWNSENNLLVVQLPTVLHPGSELAFEIRLTFVHPGRAQPSQVTQYDDIWHRYELPMKWSSPYSVGTINTRIVLPSSEVSSIRSEPTITRNGKQVSISGNDGQGMFWVRYKTTKPFVTAKTCIKEIEVSHWGNIAFEEQFEIVNSAANLTGSFSRLDYDRSGHGRSNSAKVFSSHNAVLPLHSFGLYYRDNLGNVTTSSIRRSKSNVLLDFKTRFPLLPAWTADFYYGYNVPSQHFLSRDSDTGRFNLACRFSSTLKGLVVDELIVRVILPEGASNFQVSLPFSTKQSDLYHRGTYLDTTGRPVLEFKVKNATPFHNRMFTVTYDFPSMLILLEPMYLVAIFLVFFLGSILYSKCDFSLGSQEESKSKRE